MVEWDVSFSSQATRAEDLHRSQWEVPLDKREITVGVVQYWRFISDNNDDGRRTLKFYPRVNGRVSVPILRSSVPVFSRKKSSSGSPSPEPQWDVRLLPGVVKPHPSSGSECLVSEKGGNEGYPRPKEGT